MTTTTTRTQVRPTNRRAIPPVIRRRRSPAVFVYIYIAVLVVAGLAGLFAGLASGQ